jgi:pimeloyl-ACP methyl ester carboxylesterase
MNSATDTVEHSVRSRDGTRIGYRSLGAGPHGLIVLGGALRTGEDYLPFARARAQPFAVHVVDRRGRGTSGPQAPDHRLEHECEDLLAVLAATGAEAVFGHSFGGLVALETARRTDVFSRVAVYEPGVSLDGSIPLGWLAPYRERLAADDRRGAFAAMVRQGGFAPRFLTRMPLRYIKLVLRLAIREERWRRIEPLLESSLREHELVAQLDDDNIERFRSITAHVLLLGGSKSPAFLTDELLPGLASVIPDSTIAILDRLDHLAPDERAPEIPAQRVLDFLSAREPF